MLLDEIKQATGGLSPCAELLITNAIRRDRERFAVGFEGRVLLWVYDNQGRRAGYGVISGETGMAESTVRNALKRLVRYGAIWRSERVQGSNEGSSYTIGTTL
jgi:hypothetical protein